MSTLADLDKLWTEIDAEKKNFGKISLDVTDKDVDEIKISTKMRRNPEEINKYSINETWTLQQKSMHIAKLGNDDQKFWLISLIVSSPQQSHLNFNCEQALTQLLETIPKSSTPTKLYFAKSIGLWVENNNYKLTNKTEESIVLLAKDMMDPSSPDQFELFGHLYANALLHVSQPFMDTQVIQQAVSCSEITNNPVMRGWACKVLGTLLRAFPEYFKARKAVFEKIQRLSQDLDHRIRACFVPYVKYLNAEPHIVIHELMELAQDEESSVREIAIAELMLYLSRNNDPNKKQQQQPSMDKVHNDLKPILNGQKIMEGFGEFMKAISPIIPQNDMNSVLSRYLIECSSESLESRSTCIKSFKEITPLVMKVFNDRLIQYWKTCTMKLSKDSSVHIRRQFAEIFPVICKESQIIQNLTLMDEFKTLLKDTDPIVVSLAFESLPDILSTFASKSNWNEGPPNMIKSTLCLEDILSTIEVHVLKNNFSKHYQESLFHQLPNITQHFAESTVQRLFIPSTLRILTNTTTSSSSTSSTSTTDKLTYPSLKYLCHTLGHLFHICTIQEVRRSIVTQIMLLSVSSSFRDRLICVTFCDAILERCSSKAFKVFFWDFVWRFRRDKAADVRLALAQLLPKIRRSLDVTQNNNSSNSSSSNNGGRVGENKGDKVKLEFVDDVVNSWMETEKSQTIVELMGRPGLERTEMWLAEDLKREKQECINQEIGSSSGASSTVEQLKSININNSGSSRNAQQSTMSTGPGSGNGRRQSVQAGSSSAAQNLAKQKLKLMEMQFTTSKTNNYHVTSPAMTNSPLHARRKSGAPQQQQQHTTSSSTTSQTSSFFVK